MVEERCTVCSFSWRNEIQVLLVPRYSGYQLNLGRSPIAISKAFLSRVKLVNNDVIDKTSCRPEDILA